VLRLDGARRVETLIGSGLFDFGHVNGTFAEARLQHPLGIAWWTAASSFADSYNGTIRSVDPKAGTVSDLDDGFLCTDSLCLPLAEPAGIAVDGALRLLVADTNNHRVVEYDVAARRTGPGGIVAPRAVSGQSRVARAAPLRFDSVAQGTR